MQQRLAQVEKAFITELAALEQAIPSLSWLISSQALHDLGQHLKKLLDVCLPDGRRALLRFWDPRVLHHLARTLDEPQREALFGHVHEWHLLHNSKRVWIGRPSC